MNDKEFKDRVDTLLEVELKEPLKICYMSFVDEERPVGQRFVGAIFTIAHGITDAIQKTHRLGINPGGQVLFTEAPKDFVLDQKYLDRLLTREEVESM